MELNENQKKNLKIAAACVIVGILIMIAIKLFSKKDEAEGVYKLDLAPFGSMDLKLKYVNTTGLVKNYTSKMSGNAMGFSMTLATGSATLQPNGDITITASGETETGKWTPTQIILQEIQTTLEDGVEVEVGVLDNIYVKQ